MGWPAASNTVPVSSVGWSVMVTVRPAIGWPRRTRTGDRRVAAARTADRRLSSRQRRARHAPLARSNSVKRTCVPPRRRDHRCGTRERTSDGRRAGQLSRGAVGGPRRRADPPVTVTPRSNAPSRDVLIVMTNRLGVVGHVVGFPRCSRGPTLRCSGRRSAKDEPAIGPGMMTPHPICCPSRFHDGNHEFASSAARSGRVPWDTPDPARTDQESAPGALLLSQARSSAPLGQAARQVSPTRYLPRRRRGRRCHASTRTHRAKDGFDVGVSSRARRCSLGPGMPETTEHGVLAWRSPRSVAALISVVQSARGGVHRHRRRPLRQSACLTLTCRR